MLVKVGIYSMIHLQAESLLDPCSTDEFKGKHQDSVNIPGKQLVGVVKGCSETVIGPT